MSTKPATPLKLFQIIDTAQNNAPVPGVYFVSKLAAKKVRSDMNNRNEDSNKLRYVVSPGPDHKHYRKSK